MIYIIILQVPALRCAFRERLSPIQQLSSPQWKAWLYRNSGAYYSCGRWSIHHDHKGSPSMRQEAAESNSSRPSVSCSVARGRLAQGQQILLQPCPCRALQWQARANQMTRSSWVKLTKFELMRVCGRSGEGTWLQAQQSCPFYTVSCNGTHRSLDLLRSENSCMTTHSKALLSLRDASDWATMGTISPQPEPAQPEPAPTQASAQSECPQDIAICSKVTGVMQFLPAWPCSEMMLLLSSKPYET